ncbi:unnamed protein product [Caenorhabditis angaria]|uniref:Tudor domain-containing protein n=1 Tax=Caenorhabditis angaria TaxID=860376 RepID=A0A9P1IND3_9PELO|nr:unnamed protein product [Caenorhabditis angaria]
MLNNNQIIKRMSIKQTAQVEIIRIISPDSFFIRPINHIANQLVYTEPFRLTPFPEYSIGNFALAPIERRKIGRCLILEKFEVEKCAKVFFVDFGSEFMVHDSCIFKIEIEQCYYPWQVIHVGLARCSPVKEQNWTEEQCRQFEELLNEFQDFEIIATDYDMDNNWDRSTIKVNLFGIPIDGDEKVSIEDIFACSCPFVAKTVLPSNYKDSNLSSEWTQIFIDSTRLNFPEDWQFEEHLNNRDEDEWEMKEIPNFPIENSSNLIGFIDCSSTISPYEMYIRPIHPKNEIISVDEWLIEDYEDFVEFSQDLDDFYKHLINQRPFSYDEIEEYLENGRVFGICSSSSRTNSSWHRIEIYGIQNESVHIKYLDIGGMTHVKLRQVHRLNSKHAKQPPFCVQVKINKIHENEDVFWSADLCQIWADLIPYDVPVQFDEIEMNNDTGNVVSSNLSVLDEDEDSLIEQFVEMSQGRVKYFS